MTKYITILQIGRWQEHPVCPAKPIDKDLTTSTFFVVRPVIHIYHQQTIWQICLTMSLTLHYICPYRYSGSPLLALHKHASTWISYCNSLFHLLQPSHIARHMSKSSIRFRTTPYEVEMQIQLFAYVRGRSLPPLSVSPIFPLTTTLHPHSNHFISANAFILRISTLYLTSTAITQYKTQIRRTTTSSLTTQYKLERANDMFLNVSCNCPHLQPCKHYKLPL